MTEDLKQKIKDLVSNMKLLRSQNTAAQFDKLFTEIRQLANTPEEIKEAGEYLRNLINEKRKRPDVDIKNIIKNIQDIISLSYIAEKFFDKDRTWLYQRINGTCVNGKPAAFTEKELKILADSLEQISQLISDTSTSIKQTL